MIRNFLLDMGNVILLWDPLYIVEQYTHDDGIKERILKGLVYTQDWRDIDSGAISDEELIERTKGRMAESLHPLIEEIGRTWHRQMPPMPGAQAFIEQLKDKGYGVYMLSNAGRRFPECVNHLPVMKLLDGQIVSAHVGAVKPDRRIYEIALETFGLKAEECVFLDDMPENVEGAKAAGIEAFVFDGDFRALKQKLRPLGVELT